MRPAGDKQLGGVVLADNADEVADLAGRMLGNVLVTKQTGATEKEVRRVLIAEAMDIEREYYLVLLDRATKCPVFVASAEGGTEIEEVAEERPDASSRSRSILRSDSRRGSGGASPARWAWTRSRPVRPRSWWRACTRRPKPTRRSSRSTR